MPDDGASFLPPAHPDFTAHFTDPLYDSEGDEFGPFGSDEGWDMIVEWGRRRSELEQSPSLRTILGDGDPSHGAGIVRDLREGPEGDVDTPVVIVSAGFVLLRLTGSIDPEGREVVLAGLDRLEAFYGPPTTV